MPPMLSRRFREKTWPPKMGIEKNQHRDFSAAKARDDFSKTNHGDMGLPDVG